MARELSPVLLIGGAGAVGRRVVEALRRRRPELPLWIGGRDVAKAEALARRTGAAAGVGVDLSRSDLGLAGASPSAVVALLDDQRQSALRFAQARGVPFVAFSDWLFGIAPEVAEFMYRPAAAPVLLLGHVLGGTVTATALHFARELRRVRSIQIGLVVDSDDGGGPANQDDFARLAEKIPSPLLRIGGRWVWVQGERAERRFVDAEGHERLGQALPLLDVPSLAAATGAADVRVDLAVRDAATRAPGSGASHSVRIELAGDDAAGAARRSSVVLLAPEGHALTSAHGAVLAIERLLGLVGERPAPGLYQPETLFEPADVVAQLRALGVRIERR